MLYSFDKEPHNRFRFNQENSTPISHAIMTHPKSFYPLILTLILSSQLPGSRSQYPEDGHYFVEPNLVLVKEWEGWGTSLVWWADMLGGMDDQVMKNVTDAFFNKDKLNFNIVRYGIGGTTPKEVVPYPCGDYRPGAATESFRDGPDQPYNWTRDSRQIKILQEAISRGVNILEAFSNSPPHWMTVSGCAKGNYMRFPLHDNLDPEAAPAFAEYVTEVMEHFRTELGITFAYYAPFNEPFGLLGIGSWFGRDASQEGCNMKRSTMVEVVRQMEAALRSKGMNYVTLTGADETQINTAVATANYFKNEDVAKYLTKWNVHGYWDVPRFQYNRRDLLNIIANKGDQKLWMDEMGWPATWANDTTQAMDIGRRILSDLKHLHPSAWVYWQAMESTGEWGIISVPYRFDATLDEIEYNSGYYAMMQFSQYIKQGYRLIFVNDPETVAAFDPISKTLVLVIVHEPKSNKTKRFDLHRFDGDLTITSMTRTSSTEHHAIIPTSGPDSEAEITDRHLILTTPPTSITTIVISADVESDFPHNFLVNAGFEEPQTGEQGWTVTGNGSILAEELPWRGNHHGFLPPSPGEESVLSQNFTLNTISSAYLYLTLFVSTKGSDTWIEGWVQGSKVVVQKVHNLPGYRAYGLSFPARPGDEVTIRVRSATGKGPVYVDNALVRFELRDIDEDESPNSAPARMISFFPFMGLLVTVLKTFY